MKVHIIILVHNEITITNFYLKKKGIKKKKKTPGERISHQQVINLR